MRVGLFLSAAAAALALASGTQAQNGYAGIVHSNTSADTDGSVLENENTALEGAFSFGDAITVELDGQIADDESGAAVGLTAHVYKRTERFLIGGYAAFADEDEQSTTEYGFEGNLFLDRLTLAGAYGSATIDPGGSIEGDGYSLEARYFPSDDVRLQAGVGRSSADIGYFDDVEFTSFGLSGEMRFGDSPVSVLVSWARTDESVTDQELDTFAIGARFNWDSSLFERDRHGPSQGHAAVGGSFVF